MNIMTVLEVKDKLSWLRSLCTHGFSSKDTKWNEGYISALVDNEIINEGQFEELLEWIREEL